VFVIIILLVLYLLCLLLIVKGFFQHPTIGIGAFDVPAEWPEERLERPFHPQHASTGGLGVPQGSVLLRTRPRQEKYLDESGLHGLVQIFLYPKLKTDGQRLKGILFHSDP
jgi:hypothetical protein